MLSPHVVHLTLRGRYPHPLVLDEDDWQALAFTAKRMLFWCGGAIHGCRCEGRELRFALQLGNAPVGAMARHISAAYAAHLRRRRGRTGRAFNHYAAIPVDAELFLDDLVIWLHRPPQTAGKDDPVRTGFCWTANSAYLVPNSLNWITTGRVLAALSPGGAGRSVYLRRVGQPIAAGVVSILTGRGPRRAREPAARGTPPRHPTVESIAHFVAAYSSVTYEDMCSRSRRRDLSKAKTLAAVLATRNGASVADVARLFGRCRSTLVERAEGYRSTQPQIFMHAERALEKYLGNAATNRRTSIDSTDRTAA